ncbi:MAG TPA: hypothetical protein VIK04_18050 [Solirubrobacteraceae bacterium]
MKESPVLTHIWKVDPAHEADAVEHLDKMFGGITAERGFVSAKVLQSAV